MGIVRRLPPARSSSNSWLELYIVSGPTGVGGTGSLGGVTTTLADGHVTVPSSTWEVALVLPKDGGDDLSRVSCSTRTIAVIMPNQDSIRNDPWDNLPEDRRRSGDPDGVRLLFESPRA